MGKEVFCSNCGHINHGYVCNNKLFLKKKKTYYSEETIHPGCDKLNADNDCRGFVEKIHCFNCENNYYEDVRLGFFSSTRCQRCKKKHDNYNNMVYICPDYKEKNG